MEEFILKFKDQFEDFDTVEINEFTDFKSLETWDSLTAFSVISMIDDDYNVEITQSDLKNCTTVAELYDLVTSRNK
jgi:acyl carrier protein